MKGRLVLLIASLTVLSTSANANPNGPSAPTSTGAPIARYSIGLYNNLKVEGSTLTILSRNAVLDKLNDAGAVISSTPLTEGGGAQQSDIRCQYSPSGVAGFRYLGTDRAFKQQQFLGELDVFFSFYRLEDSETDAAGVTYTRTSLFAPMVERRRTGTPNSEPNLSVRVQRLRMLS
jgi:hypothetical protein